MQTLASDPANAFSKECHDEDGKYIENFPGLSKREYFAAMAMQGIISRVGVYDNKENAAAAVEAADELIKALNQ